MTPFFAFLHHLAAFSLVAALAVEFILIRGEINLGTARKLRLADMVFGLSSGVVLGVGLLRVFYFEKGASYYFHSAPFIAKLSLFAVVGLLSIYPTIEFVSWRKSLKRGQMPALPDRKIASIRSVIHWELSATGIHSVQRTWLVLDVTHCGYCQSSQFIAAASLRRKKPQASDADIYAAMTDICRCGTDLRIRSGVYLASVMVKKA